MNRFEIMQAFNKEYKRPNYLAPNIYSRGKKGNLLYEIRFGRGFNKGRMYSVSMLERQQRNRYTRRPDLNNAGFISLEEVHAYIKKKADEYKEI